MTYPEYPKSATALEEQILERWTQEELFRRTLEHTAGGDPFVFYEGPPTANGRPGIHHVISRTIKDLVCRYHTMRGRSITRIAGWDTHGLPVEIEAEKRLGISGKRQIEEVGVARFNQVCRDSVFTYKDDWERLSQRIGYWLDYSKPYITFAPEYIESVWNIFERLADRELIYRGHKSVPYCPRCGTALSSHEVAQGYEDVADPSIYFACEWQSADGVADAQQRHFLVWTTTPWTLPSNVALAVHPELTYAEVAHDGRRYVLAEPRVAALFGDDAVIVARHTGAALVGQRYRRPFEWLEATSGAEAAWRVYAESFVTADDGTGIVHLAPAFGADDYAAGQRHGLPMFRPVDDAGRFNAALPLVGGMFVKDADEPLVDELRRRGVVFRYSLETHTYPHCWRCSSPLLYMARDSWYLRTTAVRDAMLANNAQVSWHPPEVGTGRFGEWLEGNVDWAISRERYWGTPLPIWVCDAEPDRFEVIGSFAALAERAGTLPADFDPHKPFIDEVAWTCDCGGTMRRTPEVIDVWFDSGAMPYAQWHYPFENRDEWRRHFPADFICEGVDQTRGWFYSLMAIATMLGDGPAYRNVVVNDLLLDAEGQKMSKSRGNVVDPWDAIARFGADAIRWYLITVSVPWVPKRFDPAALSDAARRVFDTLGNTYRFFAMYAGLEGWRPHADAAGATADAPGAGAPADAAGVGDCCGSVAPVLDRWVLSRVSGLAQQVGSDLDDYEITRAARAVGEFIVDDLSNWYVRRSRGRFWASGDEHDTRAAFATLHEALVTVARLLAPFTPFHADWLHRALTGGSVHLAPFPVAQPERRHEDLEMGMHDVRELARLGRAARERVRIKVRQPLRTLHAVVPARRTLSGELLAILQDELNVKEVRFLEAAESLVSLRAQPNFRVLGKRFGGRTQAAAVAIRQLDGTALAAYRAGAPLGIEVDGERFEIGGDELEIIEEAGGELLVESDAGYTVALDTAIDEPLRIEGLARELVNRIQRLRRELNFEISDRIRLGVFGGQDIERVVAQHGDYIAAETLAVTLETGTAPAAGAAGAHAVDLDGVAAVITIERA
jgi:isoleucyl-tRNA synthetase